MIPNNLVVVTKWEDMESAKNFSMSEDLKNAMKKAGVMGLPDLYYLERDRENRILRKIIN